MKTPYVESLFNKVAGLRPIWTNICQLLLLYCACITRCSLSVLLYIQHLLPHHHCYCCWYLCFFLVQIQKASENLNLISHFHWSHFHRCCFIFSFFFSVFFSFVSFFPVAANKKDSFKLRIDENVSAHIDVTKTCSC